MRMCILCELPTIFYATTTSTSTNTTTITIITTTTFATTATIATTFTTTITIFTTTAQETQRDAHVLRLHRLAARFGRRDSITAAILGNT